MPKLQDKFSLVLAFFSQGGEFTPKHLVRNPFPTYRQVRSQPLEEFGKPRCLCGEACVWEQGSSREPAFLQELSKDKHLSLTAALLEERRRGSGRILIRDCKKVHCAFAYMKSLLLST